MGATKNTKYTKEAPTLNACILRRRWVRQTGLWPVDPPSRAFAAKRFFRVFRGSELYRQLAGFALVRVVRGRDII